ncbi:MAG: endonuclease/exonuclease/phosphatase family protein [Patescibacteria group bacterium]|nr:endonuclease/exonuclease/phosphatase family protein [Patescibacteria group bacterium]MDD5164493.1 endonuclease/exonuclease/phosphatase family protein [Patescibacteria group bacterium]MDD5534143.1 endonuclease/exonuclease/phosphatase family protein [Patescibacteria group bacterium]
MKLITLNIWGGRVFNPLMDFFKKHAQDTDIFCLQEVFNNPLHTKSKVQQSAKEDIYQDIASILKEFNGYFAPRQDNEESLAMFIRKDLDIKEIGDHFVYRWKNAMENEDLTTWGVNLQYLKFIKDGKEHMICNLHGQWCPDFKKDNPIRLEQSENTKKFLDNFDGLKILCGDFNLTPDTKSMAILESSMKNLIKEYNVTSTRSHLYKKDIKFADYVLVSPEIKVKNFEVIQDVISDHLALSLDF